MLWAPKFRKLAKYMHMVSISLPTGTIISGGKKHIGIKTVFFLIRNNLTVRP